MNFQEIIFKLQTFWGENKCAILQPYDLEVGAGTSHPATTLRTLDQEKWNVAYVQPSRRPTDGRYAENPFRMQQYYQFQVILKPSPENIQQLCLDSFKALGLDEKNNDFRFVEDDWKNPTIGAWGLGWEVWCNGMEICQFTFMQQIGGVDFKGIPGEITYGLERIAMYIQGVESVWELDWNGQGLKYKDVFMKNEQEFSKYNFELANIEILQQQFRQHIEQAKVLLEENLPLPAFDHCLKTSHIFNVLEARGVLSVTERAEYMKQVREVSCECCKVWQKKNLEKEYSQRS